MILSTRCINQQHLIAHINKMFRRIKVSCYCPWLFTIIHSVQSKTTINHNAHFISRHCFDRLYCLCCCYSSCYSSWGQTVYSLPRQRRMPFWYRNSVSTGTGWQLLLLPRRSLETTTLIRMCGYTAAPQIKTCKLQLSHLQGLDSTRIENITALGRKSSSAMVDILVMTKIV